MTTDLALHVAVAALVCAVLAAAVGAWLGRTGRVS
jgi:hypothetical protein